MKFLGWMHRKFVQNNVEMMNSTIGNPLFDKQNYAVETTETLFRSNIKCQKSSNRFNDNTALHFQEESFEPFDFLSIGTFGMELLNSSSPTPTLPMPYEKLSNQLNETTENDLKLISYELERFLETEEKDIPNDASGRCSIASIITLSNKPIEGAESEDQTFMVDCPLQNYLLANATGMSQKDKEVKKEKISPEEFFQRNNTVYNNDHMVKCEVPEQQPGKSATFMKKVVKKIRSSSSSFMVSCKNDSAKSISIKEKLSKALKMLHKKVHPEEITNEHIVKLPKDFDNGSVDEYTWPISENKENKMVLKAPSKNCEKNTMKLSPNAIFEGAPIVTGEQWIKTDSDYLVLEL